MNANCVRLGVSPLPIPFVCVSFPCAFCPFDCRSSFPIASDWLTARPGIAPSGTIGTKSSPKLFPLISNSTRNQLHRSADHRWRRRRRYSDAIKPIAFSFVSDSDDISDWSAAQPASPTKGKEHRIFCFSPSLGRSLPCPRILSFFPLNLPLLPADPSIFPSVWLSLSFPPTPLILPFPGIPSLLSLRPVHGGRFFLSVSSPCPATWHRQFNSKRIKSASSSQNPKSSDNPIVYSVLSCPYQSFFVLSFACLRLSVFPFSLQASILPYNRPRIRSAIVVHPLFVRLSIYPLFRLSTRSSDHPSFHPPIYSIILSIYTAIHICICLSILPSTSLSIYPATHAFIQRSTYASVHSFFYPPIYLIIFYPFAKQSIRTNILVILCNVIQ